jgi:hypothetical protein
MLHLSFNTRFRKIILSEVLLRCVRSSRSMGAGGSIDGSSPITREDLETKLQSTIDLRYGQQRTDTLDASLVDTLKSCINTTLV